MSGPRRATPPLVARSLLGALPRPHRDYVRGDLDEEFTEEVLPARGPFRARLWYWGQVVRTLWAFARRRPTEGVGLGPPRRRLPPVFRELRHAWRGLRRRPGFTALAVVTLGVGIGAVTSVFSLADGLLLRPVPGVEGQDALGRVWFLQEDGNAVGLGLPTLQDLATGTHSFTGVAAHQRMDVQVAGDGLGARVAGAEVVSGAYFSVLGVHAARGRLFGVEEADTPDPHAVVVVSDAFWHRVLEGDPGAVGRELRVNGTPFTVVGVTPPGFLGTFALDPIDVWVPASAYELLRHRVDDLRLDDRKVRIFGRALVRLRPGVSLEQAQADLRGTVSHLAEAYPDADGIYTTYRPTLSAGIGPDTWMRDRTRSTLEILGVLVLVVLFIACANVAGLLLLRGQHRRGETAVRRALGASAGQLAVFHLGEALLLAAPATLAGLGVAHLMDAALRSAHFSNDIAELATVDVRALAVAAGVAGLTALLFGALPALAAARVDVNAALKGAQRTASRASGAVQAGLIVAQLSLALALVSGAILLHRTMANLQDVHLGFDPDGVTAFQYDPGPQGYDEAAAVRFHQTVLDEARALPGVEAAGVSLHTFFSGWGTVFTATHPADETRSVDLRVDFVSADVLDLMGIPVLAGRTFTREETAPTAPATPETVVLTRSAAVRLWGTPERAIGRTLAVRTFDGPARPTVIGVVDDVVDGDLRRDPRPKLYLPLTAVYQTNGTLLVRSSLSLGDLTPAVRRILAGVDPNVPLAQADDIAGRVAEATTRERTFLDFSALLAAVAVLFAAVGLYSVVAYAAVQRRREFGIRLALGATGRRLTRLVLGHALAFGVAGVGVGLGVALLGRRLLAGLLFGVDATDPSTLGLAAGLLMLVALAAALTPALHATRVDPATTLRSE